MTNIDERIKQCDVDIKALEEQKQKLLEEKNRNTIKAGDIVVYPADGSKRLIVSIDDRLHAVSQRGNPMGEISNSKYSVYRKIGRCAGFDVLT